MQKWFYRWVEWERRHARDFSNVSRWAQRKFYLERHNEQIRRTEKLNYAIVYSMQGCIWDYIYKVKLSLKRENKTELYTLSCLNFIRSALARLLSREMSWSNLLFRKVIPELGGETNYIGATWEIGEVVKRLFLMNTHENLWESEL